MSVDLLYATEFAQKTNHKKIPNFCPFWARGDEATKGFDSRAPGMVCCGLVDLRLLKVEKSSSKWTWVWTLFRWWNSLALSFTGTDFNRWITCISYTYFCACTVPTLTIPPGGPILSYFVLLTTVNVSVSMSHGPEPWIITGNRLYNQILMVRFLALCEIFVWDLCVRSFCEIFDINQRLYQFFDLLMSAAAKLLANNLVVWSMRTTNVVSSLTLRPPRWK